MYCIRMRTHEDKNYLINMFKQKFIVLINHLNVVNRSDKIIITVLSFTHKYEIIIHSYS